MNSHRRIRTYGKVSRKYTTSYDLKYSTQYLASEASFLNIWTNQDAIQKEDQLQPKNHIRSSDAPKVNSPSENSKTTRATRSVTRLLPATTPGSKRATGEEKSSFIMALSKCSVVDKGDPVEKPSGMNGSQDHDPETEEAIIAHDDQSSGCRTTAQASSGLNKVSEFGAIFQNQKTSRNKCPSPEASHGNLEDRYLRSLVADRRRRDLEVKDSELQEKIANGRKTQQGLSFAKENQKRKSIDLGISAHHMHRSRGGCNNPMEIATNNEFGSDSTAPSLKALCSRSPSRLGEGAENLNVPSLPQELARQPLVSTTRQSELWSLSTKGDTRRQSPLAPQSRTYESAHKDEIIASRPDPEQKIGSREGCYSQRRKRRRLLDHLSAGETSHFKGGEVLVDQGTGFNGSDDDTTEYASCVAVKTSSGESSRLHEQPQDHIPNATSISTSSMPSQGGRLKVTYARQRSFVDDAPGIIVDVAISTNLPQLQSKWQEDESIIQTKSEENFEAAANSQGGMMRSVHELRKAGSNARAVSNMDALLDDILQETGCALEYRMSRLLELIMKLQDDSYCRLFIGQGLDLRLLSCLGSEKNITFKALFAAAILPLLVPSTCHSKLYQTKDPSLSRLLLELLDHDEKLKFPNKTIGSKNSEKEHADFERSWETLLKSAAWSQGRPPVLTARTIGLQCLEYLARYPHDPNQPTAGISPDVFWSVARILNPDFSVSVRQPNLRSQLDLQLALSVLDIYTIENGFSVEESIWKGETLGYLRGFLSCLGTWHEVEIDKLRTLTLRLYLNLMNNRPKLCEVFSTTDVVGPLLIVIVTNFRHLAQRTGEASDLSLDSLILALGSMINLAEWCPTTPQLVMNLRHDDASFLDVLLQLYVSKQVEVQDVSTSHPRVKHLACLLAQCFNDK